MRVKGIRVVANQQQIALAIHKHTGKTLADSMIIAQQILNGNAVEFAEDWALEQDLRDLGVKF